MANPDGRVQNPNQRKITKIVDGMDSNNKEQKTRLLFAYEIQNQENEIVFLTEKNAILQKKIDNFASSIGEIESRLIDPIKELRILLQDREKTNAKMAQLKKLELEYKKKISLSPILKGDISKDSKEVQRLTSKLKIIEQKWEKIAAEQKELEEFEKVMENRISSFESEVPILRNTKSLLYGILPEGYDLNVMDEISVDYDNYMQKYCDDINKEIDRVREQIQHQEDQITGEVELGEQKRHEKLSLEEDIKSLLEGEQYLTESMVSEELIKYRSRNEELDEKKNILITGVHKTKREIAELNKSIEEQQNKFQALKDRHQILGEIQLRVDKMEDVTSELRKIEANRLKIEFVHNCCNNLNEAVHDIKNDLVFTNEGLKSIYGEYNAKLEDLKKLITLLFLHDRSK